jgi:hypothetical protein
MIKVSTVIHSHLNDVAIEMSFNRETAQHRLNFVKYLISAYPDTSVKVDIDEVYRNWQKSK